MKCSKCGAELSDDTKFCSYCGYQIEESNSNPDEFHKEDEKTPENIEPQPVKDNPEYVSKSKEKGKKFWNKLNSFEKICTVLMVALVVFCLVAFLFDKILAGIVALLQIALISVALLIKKQIIKTPINFLHIIAIVLALVMAIPYVCLFKVDSSHNEKITWSDIVLCSTISEPKSRYGEIYSNSGESLFVSIYKTSESQYVDYINACKEKGFTVDVELLDSSFEAYDSAGYKLSLSYYERDNEMMISLDAPEELGTLNWPQSTLAKLVPAPQSNTGRIDNDDEKSFVAYVGDVSIDAYNEYVILCKGNGFTIDTNDAEKSFSAKNAAGNKLTVEYIGNNVICISLSEPEYNIDIEVQCVKNLLFSTYSVDVYIDDNLKGTLANGATDTYSVVLKQGKHTLKFVSTVDDTLTGKATMNISKDDSLIYKISCTSTGIGVEALTDSDNNDDASNQNEMQETNSSVFKEITVTKSADDFFGLDYHEAENQLKTMGFTVFEYQVIETDDDTNKDDAISSIEIKSWIFGDSDFEKGDTFYSDDTVVLWYYDYEEPEAPSPVFYSSNNYETAKKGNTGVFSYKNRGGTYDVYWIVDFDKGYVYNFTEGNGESTCDRLKIESGDLNSSVKITWHDGGDEWSYGLHFKYQNSPETLIVQDHNGFDIDFYTTDLSDALTVRNSKTIKDY